MRQFWKELDKRLNSANRRIVVVMTCVLLIGLWGGAGFWSWWERSSIIASNTLVLEQLNNAVQEQTKGLLQQAQTSLIVATDWTSKHPDEDPGTSPHFIELIDKLRKASDQLIDIRMVSRSGELRYIPDRGQTSHANVADRDYFRAQFDDKSRGFFIGNPVIGKVTGKWGFPISVPVEKAGGDVAVLFAVIEFDRIVNSFEAQRVKPKGTIAIIRKDGTLLYRSPMEETALGKPIASGSEWERFLGLPPKGVLVSRRSPVDGLSRMVSYSRSQDYPLVVHVTAGLDDMLSPWKFHNQVLAAVAGVISFFILGMAYILLRSMASEVGVKRELERLMLTDPLTGVGNRRFLTSHLEEEVLRAERYGRALTAVFFDLDHFKQVNDEFGHKVGDIVLIRVAQSLSASIRQSDYIGRFGGEEFVVLLTETGIEDGLMLVERMREAVGNLEIPELPQGITISAGLAQWKPGESAEALLQRSDRALYRAKAEGRNSSFVDLIP